MNVNIRSTLRYLASAALLAATAALGGSGFVDPATACAVPGEWDFGNYEACLGDIRESDADRDQERKKECCQITDGQWKKGSDGFWDCYAPPIGSGPTGILTPPPPPPGDVVPRPSVTSPTDAASETPPTPRLPLAPQPSGNATVAPPPAAPPTTSTMFPPPR
jgi:hypothetical protein